MGCRHSRVLLTQQMQRRGLRFPSLVVGEKQRKEMEQLLEKKDYFCFFIS